MEDICQELIRKINSYIIEGKDIDFNVLLPIVLNSNLDIDIRMDLFAIISNNSNNVREINKKLHDYYMNEKSSNSGLNFNISDKQIEKDYNKYKNVILWMMGIGKYKWKKAELNAYCLNNIFGNDYEQLIKDIESEGKIFLVECLRSYDETKGASKLTFIKSHLKNRFENLSKKSILSKYKHIEVEFDECDFKEDK